MGEASNSIELNINQEKETKPQLDREDIKTSLIGKVPKRVEKAVVDVTLDIFKKMDFNGVPPEKIEICDGDIILPSGEKIAACYEYDEKTKKPGNISLSCAYFRKSFSWFNRIPDYIAVAACDAHEVVHHVQVMRGEKPLGSFEKIPAEIHVEDKCEQEANRITKEVIAERYGYNVTFPEEFRLKKNK